MSYYKICYEEEQFWIELNEMLIATRQIIIDENLKIHLSAREDCLAEGIVIVKELEGNVKEITKEEFENQWMLNIKKYFEAWINVKNKYPIGKKITGTCKYFYPDGAVVEGDDFFAIYVGENSASLNCVIKGTVKGYDENNLWLIFE